MLPDSRWHSRTRTRLSHWFTAHARQLPWREQPTPYRVWVSEIMCQQTQIATVLPYFERFIKRYPDAAALAAAQESELMRLWEGLGYYRRARSMHAAAKQIVANHEGEFPLNYADAIALPGIGRYTAGAILSIAANQRQPILEGNTIRVFSRLLGLRQSVDEKASQDLLWQFAEQLLPKKFARGDRQRGPAAINQAAMELGALVCTPRAPQCLSCPLSKLCRANSLGLQTQIPVKTQKIKYEARTEHAALIRDPQGAWLVRQIPANQRFAGMWDFPKAGPPEAENTDEFQRWLTQQIGGRVQIGEQLTAIKHAVTKYRITLCAHAATHQPAAADLPSPWAFRSPEQLHHLPMSTTGRRLLAWIERNACRLPAEMG